MPGKLSQTVWLNRMPEGYVGRSSSPNRIRRPKAAEVRVGIAELWRRDALVATRTPIREQDAEVGAIHYTVDVQVARDRRSSVGCWSPVGKQHAKIAAVDDAIDVDVTDTFSGVGDVVVVGVGNTTTSNLFRIINTVMVTVFTCRTDHTVNNRYFSTKVPDGL
jgi:hypothetical protein